MRQCTLDAGSFTVQDIAEQTGIPRSTAQDWINRLLSEQCLTILSQKRGRNPARYAAISAIPQSACRRIFTTIDQDEVEIYHECLSRSCAAFCEHHHRLSGGVLTRVDRDGTLLREHARLGEAGAVIGLYPRPAVGVVSVRRNQDGTITQRIRCVGGPAYSLTEMMTFAEGVCHVTSPLKEGEVIEGEVTTRALTYLAIGVDDTDCQGAGATFALSLALLQYLSKTRGVLPIGHQVVMLNPALEEKTAGNAASFIEMAIEPALLALIQERSHHFVADESFSSEWGVAIKTGFIVSPRLRAYGELARNERITREDAERIAREESILLRGGKGVIGALAALACIGQDSSILLDPRASIEVTGQ
jgi:hypothetical protein